VSLGWLRVEKCSPDFVDGVVVVEERTFKPWERYPRGFIELLCDRCSDTSFVALVNDRVVGYVIACVERGCEGHIISLAVLDKFRRMGIGRLLLCTSLKALMKGCVNRVFLEVRVENYAAISLYRSVGFRTVAYLPQYYSDGGDAYKMVLNGEPRCH